MPPTPPVQSRPAPRNEAELLQDRPSDHVDGLFPRELLLPGERVLYSARPSLRRSIGWGTGFVLVLFVLDGVGTIAAAVVSLAPGFAGASAAGSAAVGGAVGLALWGGILAVLLWSRARSVYALTNLRAVALRGLGGTDYRSVELTRVARLHLVDAPSDSVVFAAAATPGTPGAVAAREVRWVGLRYAPRSLAFAQAAFAVEAARVASESRASRKESVVREGRIACAYCGNLVLVESLAPTDRRCPRCAAPLPASTPTRVAAPAASPPGADNDEVHAVRHLRPAVHLASELLPWYRALATVWALCCGFVTLLALAAPGGPLASLAALLTAAAMLVVLTIIGYVLWAQTVRKWGAVVRTLRGSLLPGSEWHGWATRSLALGYRLMLVAFVGSIVLPLGAWLAQLLLTAGGASGTGAGPPGATTFTLAALAWGGAVFGGQLLLVRGLPRVASGSEIPEVDRDLARGRRVAELALLATWVLPLLAIYEFLAPGASPYVPLLALLGVPAAAALAAGLGELGRGFDRWSRLAERVYFPAFSPTGRGVRGEGFVPTPSRVDARSAGRLVARLPGRAWTIAGVVAILGVLALAAVSAEGALGPWLNEVARGGAPAGPPPPAPVVVAAAGSSWSIPVDHYEYDTFRTNHTGTLSGSFAADGPVIGYIMDSNDYNIWQFEGHVVYNEYSTGNVTHGAFQFPLNFSDRWYVVVVNENPSAEVTVTWSTECVATF